MKSSTFKRRLMLGGYTLLLFFTVQAQPLPSASVHGTVTNAATGSGLRKAYLRLAPVSGGRDKVAYAVVTNDQGAFAIENVAPGNYRLDAECAGFLDAHYGGAQSDETSVELRLSAGDKLTGIEIKMTPQAVLSGRVLDQDGDPWPHVYITVFHSVWKKGRRQIEFAHYTGPQEADDRGEFRLTGFAPGRYYVLATPDSEWEKWHHPDLNHQPAVLEEPTWYPSAADVESAVPIVVTAGQQLNGFDIRVRLDARSSSNLRILGKLTGLQDIPAPPNSVFGGRGMWASRASTAVGEDKRYHGTIQPDGSFAIAGVPSGTYDIWIAQDIPSTPLGHATVPVGAHDVEDVSIELHAPQTLQGIIRIEGSEGAAPPRVSINLEAIDLFSVDRFAILKDAGGFEFPGLGLGRYRVSADNSARRQVYLNSIRYGNAESSDGTFTLASYGVPLEVVFSTKGARLSGTVTGKAATPQVILIPEDPARREHETLAAVFDQNGIFNIESIPPGSYKLYAFENVPEGIWQDPDFLKEVESAGAAIKVAEGDMQTMQIPLLSKPEIDRVLAKLGID